MLKLKQSLLTLVAFTLFSVGAMAEALKEGVHYKVISAQKSSEKKISEYFNYGCGACYRAEGFVSQLKKTMPKDAKFEAIPFENHSGWKIYVEAYYIADMLGILDKAHSAIFQRVHGKNKQIVNKADLKEFFVSLGADPKQFDSVASSFQLNTKMRQGRQKAIKQRVISTPSYVINDHYQIDVRAFKTTNELMQAIVTLMNK
ncbi:thiol:disulfide interchange protein DsbA/DsbL [Pleionea sp. CnH1-48]|uniref:thiol:disulfide interchange protein DsbA/DsbL n=1 Tax=Pleionea sp. CnH1-48 TaxID=2954494 RepID=UPI002097B210|nr:thiol:disulfide interchange protein DsbA/DsbL [Pleionea sp. CnH1-48]MCO7226597.1 thiol:disulfide interchange protein DsbA/DsbL [Pleionea sp. CnH1-48]